MQQNGYFWRNKTWTRSETEVMYSCLRSTSPRHRRQHRLMPPGPLTLFWSFNCSPTCQSIPERQLAPASPWPPATPPTLSASAFCCRSTATMTGDGLAPPGKASNELKLLNTSRLTLNLLYSYSSKLYCFFFFHKVNWHPNENRYFTCLRLHFLPNQYWPCHRSYTLKDIFMHKKGLHTWRASWDPTSHCQECSWESRNKHYMWREQNKHIRGSCINQIWLRKRGLFNPKDKRY